MASLDHLAVLIVSYNGRALLADCLASVFASPDAPPPANVIVVENASSDDTWSWLTENYPGLTRLRSATNLGFAGGNNLGFEHLLAHLPQVKYVALLNQDTLVQPHWLSELANLADLHPEAAAIQSKLMFHPETTLFNSAGNRAHYLGFGFVRAYREPDRGQYDAVCPLGFPSGAAMLVRVDAFTGWPLFNQDYFAYLEDAELGWSLRLRGHQVLFCPSSVVYHRYQFTRNPQTYYRLERNRWQLLLACYRWPTLLLLLPMLLAMELGLLFYFIKVGALGQKLRSWDFLGQLPRILRGRRELQAHRQISDRQLTALFIAQVDFPEVRNPLLTWIGNPLLGLYWRCARLLLRW